MGLKLISSILVYFLLLLPTAAQNIPAVVQISVNGQNHLIIELIEHKKSILHPKAHPEYWKYKQLDTTYPITIYKKDYEANKLLLKYVPDNRPFNVKHPILQIEWIAIDVASMIIGILRL